MNAINTLHREVQCIEFQDYNVYYMDIAGANEEEVCRLFTESTEMELKSGKVFGSIIHTSGLFATPKMRQIAKSTSKISEESGRYIGSVVFGVNIFIKMIAKLANGKVQFSDDKEHGLAILNEMYKGNLPNYLAPEYQNQG